MKRASLIVGMFLWSGLIWYLRGKGLGYGQIIFVFAWSVLVFITLATWQHFCQPLKDSDPKEIVKSVNKMSRTIK